MSQARDAAREGKSSALYAAAAEPAPDRDRYVDLLRAFSICVVVLGHWLIAVVEFDGGEFRGGNALARIPGLWLLTWVLQVMPLFFFVGGFSNLASWTSTRARGGTYWQFLHSRLERLLRPVVLFAVIALPLMTLLDLSDIDEGAVALVGGTTARVLWFLGFYLVVVALTPVTVKMHEAFGARVPIALAAAVAVIDVLRLHLDVPHVGYLNFLTVWLFVHQLGYFYRDGALIRIGVRGALLLSAAGLIGLVVLTGSGLYPGSMVGLPGQRSNMDPPSVCIIALTIWQVGLAMLLREHMNSKLQQPDLWSRVIIVNVVIMTIFLWHLAVLVVANAVALPLGLPQPEVGTIGWWILRVAWLPVLGGLLALVASLLGRYEHPKRTGGLPDDRANLRRNAALIALLLSLLGILGFAVTGFHDAFSEDSPDLVVLGIDPFASFLYLLLGAWLVQAAPRRVEIVRHALVAVAASLGITLLASALSSRAGSNPLALNEATVVTLGALMLASLGAATRSASSSPRPGA